MNQNIETCPHCGQIVEKNTVFCPNCGTALQDDSSLKKARKRVNLSAIAGMAVFIGAIGSCLVVIGGGAWFTLRFFIQHPIFLVLVLVVWLFRVFPRCLRAFTKRKRKTG